MGFGTALVLALAVAAPATPKECPILPALKPVASLQQLWNQRGQLRFATEPGSGSCDGGGWVELSASGLLNFSCEEGAASMKLVTCPDAPAPAYEGRKATGSCELPNECYAKVLLDGEDVEARLAEHKRWCDAEGKDQYRGARTVHLAMSVQAASKTVLRGSAGWAEDANRAAGAPGTFVLAEGGAFERASSIQLFAGASDRSLFEAARRELQKPPAESWKRCPLLFEGPPAQKAREISEVFFVGDSNAAAAREVAKKLEPVIGKVEVKPWPGAWDYDVVVVSGARRAEGPPPAAPAAR